MEPRLQPQATSNAVAFAAGDDNLLLKTVNGGDTWIRLSTRTNNMNFKSVHFINSSMVRGVARTPLSRTAGARSVRRAPSSPAPATPELDTVCQSKPMHD